MGDKLIGLSEDPSDSGIGSIQQGNRWRDYRNRPGKEEILQALNRVWALAHPSPGIRP